MECRVYAIDLRGHGETTTSVQEDEFDLSAGKLANDILEVTTKLLGNVLIFSREDLVNQLYNLFCIYLFFHFIILQLLSI